MTPQESLDEIKKLIDKNMSLDQTIDQIINFYKNTTVLNCDRDMDEDMLLFQFGPPNRYNKFHYINFTRQYMFNNQDGEYDHMLQLSINLNYDDKVTSKSGNQWLEGEDYLSFIKYIKETEVYRNSKSIKPINIEIEIGIV